MKKLMLLVIILLASSCGGDSKPIVFSETLSCSFDMYGEVLCSSAHIMCNKKNRMADLNCTVIAGER